MRLLVVSDVHANAPALEAVLRDAERHGFDATVFLGDLVGYHPFPNECAALIERLAPTASLLGNHDALMLALIDGDEAYESLEESLVTDVLARQLEHLEPATIALLRAMVDEAGGPGWQAAHGAFRHRFEYLSTVANAQANLPYLHESVAFVGHTHVPKVFASVRTSTGDLWRSVAFRGSGERYRVPPAARAFLNPGAVGQPRDGIPLASYGMYDVSLRRFEVRRVLYDVSRTQKALHEAGYPASLATRLPLGR